MAMSKKHFVAIASAISDAKLNDKDVDFDTLVIRLSSVFKQDNPNFNADTFRAAASNS